MSLYGTRRRMKFTVTARNGSKVLESNTTYSGTEAWDIFDLMETKYKNKNNGKIVVEFSSGME